MKHTEENFSQCRVGSKSDRRSIRTGSLAIAQFEHDLSREKDPHLHTHSVIINMTPADGKMRALHNDDLFQHKRMLGTMYRNELALRIRSLGYDIELGREGTFEIAGYKRDQIEAFSKRHEQMWQRGAVDQAELYKEFYTGRRAKEASPDRAALKDEWRKATKSVELRKIEAARVLGAVLGAPPPSMGAEVAALTEKNVSIRLQDLQTARLGSRLGEGPSQLVLSECAQFARESLVQGKAERTYTTTAALALESQYRANVEAGVGAERPFASATDVEALQDRLREGNRLSQTAKEQAVGQSLDAAKSVTKRESTRDSIRSALERSVEGGEKLAPRALYALRREVEGNLRSEGLKGKALAPALRTILDPFERRVQAMTEGQIEAVCETARSRDSVILWQGVAGAGKTFSMTHVVEVARAAGYEVRGLAPSAAAATQLSKDTNVPATTVDSHLLKLGTQAREAGGVVPEPQREFWIVDEAGMLSAKNFEALSTHARERGARLLLVGDSRQIPAVEAGNPFLDLQRNSRTTVASLSESVRQRTPQLQEVVCKRSTANGGRALDILTQPQRAANFSA